MSFRRLIVLVFTFVMMVTAGHSAGQHDMASMTVSGTPGTGTITLGSANTGYQTFAAAGVVNGEIVSYSIKDGSNWEVGRGTYTSSGTTLTRGPLFSSNSNAAININDTSAIVWITTLAEDVYPYHFNTVDATTYSGTDACSRISTAANAVVTANAVGGIVDARGFSGTQTCTTAMFAGWPATGPNQAQLQVQFGAATFVSPYPFIIPSQTYVYGLANSASGGNATVFQVGNTFLASTPSTHQASGSFGSGAVTIPMAGSGATALFQIGDVCQDTTPSVQTAAVIPANDKIASISPGVSITLTTGTSTASVGTTDTITCGPMLSLVGSGNLPNETVFVKVTFGNAGGGESMACTPYSGGILNATCGETSIATLTSTNNIVVKAPCTVSQVTGATVYYVYAGTSSGGETLVNTTAGTACGSDFTINAAAMGSSTQVPPLAMPVVQLSPRNGVNPATQYYGSAASYITASCLRPNGNTGVTEPALQNVTGLYNDNSQQESFFSFAGTLGCWTMLDVEGSAWQNSGPYYNLQQGTGGVTMTSNATCIRISPNLAAGAIAAEFIKLTCGSNITTPEAVEIYLDAGAVQLRSLDLEQGVIGVEVDQFHNTSGSSIVNIWCGASITTTCVDFFSGSAGDTFSVMGLQSNGATNSIKDNSTNGQTILGATTQYVQEYWRSYNNQVYSDSKGFTPTTATNSTVASPTAPNSTSVFTMQGLGGTITPLTSGVVEITISGTIIGTGTAIDDGATWEISYGTGTAPTTNAALTGVQVGLAQTYTHPITGFTAADVHFPFAISWVGSVTGTCAIGTACWIDLAAKSITTASLIGFSNVNITAHELR